MKRCNRHGVTECEDRDCVALASIPAFKRRIAKLRTAVRAASLAGDGHPFEMLREVLAADAKAARGRR